MPKISVIVPIYNVEPYLQRCLDSILNQTFQDFEVLCINDCTPDNSMDIVDDMVRKYPDKVKRIDNEINLGLGAARDHGLACATGEYVVFFDSDDYVKKDYLKTYVQAMEESHADIVLGGYITVTEGKETRVSLKKTEITPWLYPSVWIRFFRRSFLMEHQLNFRGIRIYEDNPFNYRCMLKGAKVTVIDYCGYYYICNPTSITRGRNGMEKYQQYADNFKGVYEEYKEQEVFEKNKEILEYVYLSGLLSSMLVHSRHSGKEKAFFMYEDYKKRMTEMFPGYMHNKKIGFFRLKEEQKKVRYATAIFRMAEKLGMGRLLMGIISR